MIVHLRVGFAEALRRAASRKVWLTEDEFRMLHEADVVGPPNTDCRLRVDALDLQNQIEDVARLWEGQDRR